MAESTKLDRNAPPKSADALRMTLLEEAMKDAEKGQKAMAEEEKKHSAFVTDFLRNRVTDSEIEMVRRLVMNAVKAGKFEALVYSFPSELCTDGGRAINNSDRDWPQTLQGKAQEFYQRYLEFGRPNGYKLKAMIVNFPNGIPGDVGLFLDWAPERV